MINIFHEGGAHSIGKDEVFALRQWFMHEFGPPPPPIPVGMPPFTVMIGQPVRIPDDKDIVAAATAGCERRWNIAPERDGLTPLEFLRWLQSQGKIRLEVSVDD